MKTTVMDLSERIGAGEEIAGIKPALKKSLGAFVNVVHTLREQASERASVADLLRHLLELVKYEDHLRKGEDFDSRWENVQELISYAVIVEEEKGGDFEYGSEEEDFDVKPDVKQSTSAGPSAPRKTGRLHPIFQRKASSTSGSDVKPRIGSLTSQGQSSNTKGRQDSDAIDLDASDDDLTPLSETPDVLDSFIPAKTKEETEGGVPDIDLGGPPKATPLRLFLESSMLATDADSKSNTVDQPKVTICTVHSAKGLEWPVVFLPCIEQGTYPFYRSVEEAEIREERRLLYVAMTRARAALVMSYSKARMLGGDEQDRELSEFVAAAYKASPSTFTLDTPMISDPERVGFATVLGRPPVEGEEVKQLVNAYNATVKTHSYTTSWESVAARDAFAAQNPRSTATMFWDNSRKKDKRAKDYWESEMDEYALPPMEGEVQRRILGVPTEARFEPSGSGSGSGGGIAEGFVSARSVAGPSGMGKGKMPISPTALLAAKEGRPPRPPITSTNSKLEYPEPLPFSFGGFAGLADVGALPPNPDQEKKSQTDFLKTQQSSLNMMKSLGLPAPITTVEKKKPWGGDASLMGLASQPRDVMSFQSSSNSSLAFMKNLGSPSVGSSSGSRINASSSDGTSRAGETSSSSAGISYTIPTLHAGMRDVTKSGGGNKRLGMGGRPAPWGSKKPKMN